MEYGITQAKQLGRGLCDIDPFRFITADEKKAVEIFLLHISNAKASATPLEKLHVLELVRIKPLTNSFEVELVSSNDEAPEFIRSGRKERMKQLAAELTGKIVKAEEKKEFPKKFSFISKFVSVLSDFGG